LVQASLLGKGGRKGVSIMFEEIAVSAGHLLLIIFGLILFFIIIYSALGVQASKRAKTV